MKTTEYFQELKNLDAEELIHPEFHTYATVWMKSRMPDRYAELVARYKAIEGEIMAQHYCNDAAIEEELPF